MDVRSRRGRESSPERARIYEQAAKAKTMMRKVQVVYYLTRNGQLEHPHYMEVSHLANQPLRLTDVMERLTALRGKGMPSLYSWSCKRGYKNGYVWNDLAKTDVIFPTDTAEYVLKGSELVEGCSEKFQDLHVRSARTQELKAHLLNHPKPTKPRNKTTSQETTKATSYQEFDEEVGEEEEEEEYELDEEKTSYTSSTTPQSRCSRGVSTDELELLEPEAQQHQEVVNKNPAQLTHSHSSLPPPVKPKNQNNGNTSKRFEDGDPVAPGSGRGSVLLQLIACGSIAVAKAKNVKKVNEDLHKGVVCRNAMNVKVVGEDEDKEMIRYMSENPRFGNLQAEEKEYFSGSIVEAASHDLVAAEPAVLKKSNSYNEERSSKGGMGEAKEYYEEEKRDEKAAKQKCIPIKKSSLLSSSKQIKK